MASSGESKKGGVSQSIGLSAIATAFAHPLAYVKVLIQVGYEPLPPRKGKTFFGKDVLHLPGFLDYAKHIKNVDGWSGLYRGLAPRILHNFVNSAVANSVNSRFQNEDESENADQFDDDDDDDEPRQVLKSQSEFLIETCKLSIGKAAGVVISYPFHLISVRTMVQFVGKEAHYSNIFSSAREIYNEEGILGFFNGVIPQLVGELMAFWIFKTLSYVVETYVVHGEFARSPSGSLYIQGLAQYVASLVTFPFYLITNIMAVNNTRLAAGNPPNMPIFTNWIDCYVHLSREKLLRRGDSILRRTVAITAKTAMPAE
eukprot:Seg2775.1 transcript_id=Seg2775.1/GoldUCD/mRNA.D3Y31 product="Mitochondrial carrier 2" protein_id=Seg2775.1/GoldUCD/D3Y31